MRKQWIPKLHAHQALQLIFNRGPGDEAELLADTLGPIIRFTVPEWLRVSRTLSKIVTAMLCLVKWKFLSPRGLLDLINQVRAVHGEGEESSSGPHCGKLVKV